MKLTTLSILFLFAISSFGQITFEKGYFIDNENNKTECLIKNEDWKNNPAEIEYMLTENGTSQKMGISSIKEFSISDFSKYIRADVNIDRTSHDIDKLTAEKNPVWHREQLFLKVLVEGKASLYYFFDGDIFRFFYSVNDSILQLVYKEYLQNNRVYKNNTFHSQLWDNVKCEGSSINSVDILSYQKNQLEKYFKNYNECVEAPYFIYNEKRDFYNLRITPGLKYSALSIHNNVGPGYDYNFDKGVDLRIGLESELILPFKKNKWGVILEPTFQRYNSEITQNNETVSINYRSVDVPLGVRYSMFLNENSRIFLDAFYISQFSLLFNSSIEFENSSLEIKTRKCYATGIGYAYKRMSAEVRYYTDQDILQKYVYWYSEYSNISFILGYKLF